LQYSLDQLNETGAQVLAVSTDILDGPAALASSQGFNFPILFTSLDTKVPENYGVFNLFGDGLASASVFLVDTNGEIAWKSIGTNYRHQVEAAEIISQVNKLG
jgi:peroxiredoxin